MRQLADDSGVAPLYQDVGDRSGQTFTFGDCTEMLLALRPRDLDQVAVGELRRLCQYGSGDSYLIVVGKGSNDAMGALSTGASLAPSSSERFGLDVLDKVRKHVVKEADLFLIERRQHCLETDRLRV